VVDSHHLLHSRCGRSQGDTHLLRIESEMTSMQSFTLFSMFRRNRPDSTNFHRLGVFLLLVLVLARNFCGNPSLFIYLSLHYLRRNAGREVSVLPFLQKSRNNDFRVPSRFDTHKPPVVLELGFSISNFRFEGIANGLCAASLACEIY